MTLGLVEHLEAQRHVMPGENFEHGGGNETGKLVAVDHKDDDWRLGAMRRVEPTMLVRLAWSSWPGQASPAPELGKIQSWPRRETAHDTPLRSRSIDESRQQNAVLAPVAQEDGPLERCSAHKDVVRRRSVDRRGNRK